MRTQIRIKSENRNRCVKRCLDRQCISCGVGNMPSMKERRSLKARRKAPCSRVAERDAALLEKERAIDDLQSAIGRLETVTYSLAHDLRAPLRAIDGFSALLERDSSGYLDAGARAKLSFIRDGVRRMQSLVDDLLDLSRCESAELQRTPVSLTALAKSVIAVLRQEGPERQVEFAVAEDLTAEGDQRLLHILLANILGNAWKYTGNRSNARVEFGFDPERSAYSVRDNGVGFNMRYADKLFRPFQRLHGTAQFEGSGLGLCIARRIVERHGGRVWIESAEDQGTAVYFTLHPDDLAGTPAELPAAKTDKKIEAIESC